MKRKLSFMLIIFSFLLIFSSFYFFLSEKKIIVRKDVSTDFTHSSIINKPEKLEEYLISYRKKDFILAKYTFLDSSLSNKFFDEFLVNVDKIFVERSPININNYTGLKGKVVKPEERFGIIIKGENFVIISSGDNEKNLMRIIQWFIKRK
jgi:preprotein translocase subunit YajC